VSVSVFTHLLVLTQFAFNIKSSLDSETNYIHFHSLAITAHVKL